ncbi:unnamed protein product [Polarella glacialis]|uniref:Heavy metal-binding domain-containing protein n=1 Tax=Polarella glacialis TaxID=89957 RepID=A0A813F2M7_POLGL|nr:unnamed protein product [Polarella glacialis]
MGVQQSTQQGLLKSSGLVLVSTRSAPPPRTEVESERCIVWSSVTVDWPHTRLENDDGQFQLASRLEQVKQSLCEQAKASGCNAVLGMNFTVARDRCQKSLDVRSATVAMMGQCVVLRDVD